MKPEYEEVRSRLPRLWEYSDYSSVAMWVSPYSCVLCGSMWFYVVLHSPSGLRLAGDASGQMACNKIPIILEFSKESTKCNYTPFDRLYHLVYFRTNSVFHTMVSSAYGDM